MQDINNYLFPCHWFQVYVDELAEGDYLFICSSLYPSIPRSVLIKLISFNKRLHEETMLYHKFAQDGSPWEFNLRDVIRSCQMIQGFQYSFFKSDDYFELYACIDLYYAGFLRSGFV